MKTNFIDHVRICCRSGKGGAGSRHMFRSRSVTEGGPDGGDGGRGGHVIIEGNVQLWTLLHLRYKKHIIASEGKAGGKSEATGAQGKDVIIQVPLGTVVKDAETEEVLFEITEDGQRMILTEGGRGGRGNTHFKSATNQTPRYAQPGEEGREEWKILELKVLADVGLVGFPNAGKSTLLSVVSAAKPEIANYPFTTLVPNLGIVDHRGNSSFVMADIPGIIEGAHEGKGLGLRFLRHIERNSILLFMVPADADDINKEYEILLNELTQYNPELLDKDRVLAVSKCDMLDEELEAELKASVKVDIPVVYFSSLTQKGIQELKDVLWNLMQG